ncbi:MAG: hypothetical protein AAFR40_16820, partial [Pseudomonadota bacterium]
PCREQRGVRAPGPCPTPPASAKVEFAGGTETAPGGLTNSVAIRDWNPEQFLRNLLWSAREDRQSFLFDEADAPDMLEPIAWDPNARVVAITGAWALNLHRKIGEPAAQVRARALALRAAEAEKIAILRGKYARARVTFRTLGEVLQDPERALDPIAPLSVPILPDRCPCQLWRAGSIRYLRTCAPSDCPRRPSGPSLHRSCPRSFLCAARAAVDRDGHGSTLLRDLRSYADRVQPVGAQARAI